MPFENKSGKTQYGEIGDVVTETITSQAMADPRNMEFMELVNRERLSQLVGEEQLASSGILDPSTAAKVGEMAGIHSCLCLARSPLLFWGLLRRRRPTRNPCSEHFPP